MTRPNRLAFLWLATASLIISQLGCPGIVEAQATTTSAPPTTTAAAAATSTPTTTATVAPATTSAPSSGSGVVLSTYVDASTCNSTTLCKALFQMCVSPTSQAVNCTNTAICIQQRVACINAVAQVPGNGTCTGVFSLFSGLLELATGASSYYTPSMLYRSCGQAASLWFNDTAGSQCTAGLYLSTTCVSPVSTTISANFRGKFVFLSVLSAKNRFTAALTSDIAKTFPTTRASVSRLIVTGSRRQGTQVLTVQFLLEGVSQSNPEFLNQFSALSLNPQAFFAIAAAVYRDLVSGEALFVLGASLGGSSQAISALPPPAFTLSPASLAPPTKAPVPSATSGTPAPVVTQYVAVASSPDGFIKGMTNLEGIFVILFSVVGFLFIVLGIVFACYVVRTKRAQKKNSGRRSSTVADLDEDATNMQSDGAPDAQSSAKIEVTSANGNETPA